MINIFIKDIKEYKAFKIINIYQLIDYLNIISDKMSNSIIVNRKQLIKKYFELQNKTDGNWHIVLQLNDHEDDVVAELMLAQAGSQTSIESRMAYQYQSGKLANLLCSLNIELYTPFKIYEYPNHVGFISITGSMMLTKENLTEDYVQLCQDGLIKILNDDLHIKNMREPAYGEVYYYSVLDLESKEVDVVSTVYCTTHDRRNYLEGNCFASENECRLFMQEPYKKFLRK